MVERTVKPQLGRTPRTRWTQFSLRTVFLVVTASCAALSVWVVPAERQRQAVVAIRALDGEVAYASPGQTREPFPVRALRRWLPPDYFDDVVEVKLAASKVTDEGLLQLAGLRRLHTLDLSSTGVTDAGLVHLQEINNLQKLNLYGTKITGAGLAHLRGRAGLRWLNLNRTRLTDEGLSHLEGLTGLEEIYLDGTQITDAGLAHLKGMAGLRSIWLNDTVVTDDGLARLRALADLQWLFVGGSPVTDAGVAQLRRALSNCQIVTRCDVSAPGSLSE
jgi:uncharacterized protein YjbI with pentapeptide repeats